MGYFDDLQFLSASVVANCRAVMDRRFPGTYSVEFLLSGSMFFGIDGGPQTVLHTPSVFWHHPSHTYQYGATDMDGWHHHWVLMHGPRARRLVEQGFMPLSRRGYIGVRNAQAFAALFRSLAALVSTGSPRADGEATILVERILCMTQTDGQQDGAFRPHLADIDEVAKAIADNPMRVFDFPREAESLCISYAHFRRLFRQRVGHGPQGYLLLCRMRRAAELLADPARQVKEVAQCCGYEDPAQFSRVFRRKLGLSPQHYRLFQGMPVPGATARSGAAECGMATTHTGR